MIGQSIKIKGTVSGDENLIVEGTIEGSVDLPKNDLTIGQSGNVTADLNANTVRVDGQVTGDISGAEKVVVSKTGKVRGNIVAPRVTLEDGAKFKGSIDMDPGESTQSATAKNPPKAAAKDGLTDVSGDAQKAV
jgi:cytoskeletal protein CcmA (bactofilin family)